MLRPHEWAGGDATGGVDALVRSLRHVRGEGYDAGESQTGKKPIFRELLYLHYVIVG